MGSLKKYGVGLLGLLVALIALHFLLNQAKKLPVVGKVAGAAQQLADEGHL